MIEGTQARDAEHTSWCASRLAEGVGMDVSIFVLVLEDLHERPRNLDCLEE
jgi:hypothetical protein